MVWCSLASVLIVLRLLSCASGEQSSQWHRFKNFYFQFSSQAMDWFSARVECRKEGADLVIIDSEAKYQAVHQNINRTRNSGTNYWIGLRRNPTNVSYWLWVDGSNLRYAKWGRGEPNTTETEHCAEWWQRDNETWNDEECNSRRNYVCGREAFLSVKDHSSVQEVARGQSVTLKCPVSGFPDPNVMWYEIREEKEYILQTADGILRLCSTTRVGKKSYYCRVNNGHENTTVQIEIAVVDVPSRPSVKTFLSQDDPTGQIGDEVMLACDSPSPTRPNINYTWLKGGAVISENRVKRIHLKSDKDFGEYECVATNKVGNVSATIVIEKKASKDQMSEYIYWIIIGVLSMLVFFLILTIIVLTRKVSKKKAFVPIQNDTGEEEDEEEIPMQMPGAMPQHSAGVYADLLPRENKDQGDAESYDTTPVYVNATPRDPNQRGVDASDLYESLTPPSPSYVNVR